MTPAAAGPLEIWASPEPTVARIDATTYRDQAAETGWLTRPDDVDRIADLGVRACRFPVLWEHVAPRDPKVRNFDSQRAGIERLRARGVEPIVTLLHHGCGPRYTDLLDPAFPLLFAGYAAAAAQALPAVRRWTPINEPLTTARFSTLYGVWYPNLRDDVAFGRALVHQTLATQFARERIRAVNPAAEIVLTEDLQGFTAADPGVVEYVSFLRERALLSVELLAGRVVPGHPLYEYLVRRCAVTRRELREIAARAVAPELVAFNHYVHSERYVFSGPGDTVVDVPAVYVAGEPPLRALPLLRAAAQRVALPLALGEVHVDAPATERVRWLAQHVADVQALRADGYDVRAVGVWAAFGMVDWYSLLRGRMQAVEDGIYAFAGPGDVPQPTVLTAAVAALARGETIDDHGVRGVVGAQRALAQLGRTPCDARCGLARGLPRSRRSRYVRVTPRVFVAGLHLRWDSIWQRPQHVLSRLSRHVPVVVVEEPFAADRDRDEVTGFGNVSVIRPLRRRGWGEPFIDAAAIATARSLATRSPGPVGVWLYTPMMLPLADAFADAPLVFDCMDELAAFAGAPAGIAARDAALVERADVVFAGGRSLYDRRKSAGAKVHCYRSGVEFERFAADVAAHPLPAELAAPVFGYVGAIDERLDLDIIVALSDAFPQGHIVLVGPVVKIDAARLPRRPNVHFTGLVAYASLPSFLSGFDVAIMPFARNRATQNISPTKTLEYFAARRPVVSTPIADVVHDFADIVFIAEDAGAFVAAARMALQPDPARVARGEAVARAQSWDAIAQLMWDDVCAIE